MASIFKTDTVELKKVMVERGIKTILQLSNESGINRNTLSQILNGDIQPSAEAMDRLVSTLEIAPKKAGYIFFNSGLRNA